MKPFLRVCVCLIPDHDLGGCHAGPPALNTARDRRRREDPTLMPSRLSTSTLQLWQASIDAICCTSELAPCSITQPVAFVTTPRPRFFIRGQTIASPAVAKPFLSSARACRPIIRRVHGTYASPSHPCRCVKFCTICTRRCPPYQ